MAFRFTVFQNTLLCEFLTSSDLTPGQQMDLIKRIFSVLSSGKLTEKSETKRSQIRISEAGIPMVCKTLSTLNKGSESLYYIKTKDTLLTYFKTLYSLAAQ